MGIDVLDLTMRLEKDLQIPGDALMGFLFACSERELSVRHVFAGCVVLHVDRSRLLQRLGIDPSFDPAEPLYLEVRDFLIARGAPGASQIQRQTALSDLFPQQESDPLWKELLAYVKCDAVQPYFTERTWQRIARMTAERAQPWWLDYPVATAVILICSISVVWFVQAPSIRSFWVLAALWIPILVSIGMIDNVCRHMHRLGGRITTVREFAMWASMMKFVSVQKNWKVDCRSEFIRSDDLAPITASVIASDDKLSRIWNSVRKHVADVACEPLDKVQLDSLLFRELGFS